MLITNAAITRRSTIFVLMLIILLAGLFSYKTLPRESSPDITIPQILVQTTYEGAAPEDVEKLITLPLERKLRGVKDVTEVSSISAEGASMIFVEFMSDVDLNDALQRVRDKVDQARGNLPDDLQNDPFVMEINISEFWPVVMVAISGDAGERILKDVAEELEDRIEEFPGVLEVDVTGTRAREIRVEFDPARMAAYKLSFTEILSLVQKENVNVPGGSIDLGRGKYMLRIPGEFTNPSEIDNLVLVARQGKPIYLKDVATVRDTYEDAGSYSRLNSNKSVTLSVRKRTGQNIIEVADQVFVLLEQSKDRLPAGINLTVTLNQSKDIRNMVSELENNILTGLFLVLTVLLLFLGFRSALFVALAIPFSMLISFTVLQVMGITLNMVVLFSLILALGMLVDNAIVIVENIYRHIEEGKDRVEAARIAAAEVGWPIIASTVTTLCAFAPLMFWPDIMGEFMKFLPMTVIIVLSASLFVALVINPVVCSAFLKTSSKRSRITRENFVIRAYRKTLILTLGNRLLTVFVALVMLILIVSVYKMSKPEVELFPDPDPNRAMIQIEAPVGTNLETSDGLSGQIEKAVFGEEDLKFVITEVGVTEDFSPGTATNRSQLTLEFVDREDRHESSRIVVDRIREAVTGLPGADVTVEKERMGPPVEAPVVIKVRGPDVQVLTDLVQTIKKMIADVPGIVDVEDDLAQANPEITIEVDREKAALLGLSTIEISNTVKAAVNGWKLGDYREGEDEYDIIARLPERSRQSLNQIESLLIPTPAGDPIPLSSVAQFKIKAGFGAIRHLDQKRLISIKGNNSKRSSLEIVQDIQQRMASLKLPAGYSISYGGDYEEQVKAFEFLSKAFVIAIFMIFMVLLTQFNSLPQTLIVISSVILSLMGVFFGLMVTGMPFSVIMTGVGIISLAGVVVNNAIVLIDYINLLRKRGMELTEALVQAGTVRFRPVMLTAVTTILGLIPMATGLSFDFSKKAFQVGGESAEWWGPMAVAVIFGLAVATLLTLIVVPVLYSIAATFSLRVILRKIFNFAKRNSEEGSV